MVLVTAKELTTEQRRFLDESSQRIVAKTDDDRAGLLDALGKALERGAYADQALVLGATNHRFTLFMAEIVGYRPRPEASGRGSSRRPA